MRKRIFHRGYCGMSGRYFLLSFMMTLFCFPAFAAGQNKIESNQPTIIAEDESVKAKENSPRPFISREHTTGQDSIAVLKLAGLGFLDQFTNRNSLLLLGAAGGMTYLLSRDEMHQQEEIQRANVIGKSGQKIGDIAGLLVNIPILQMGGYFWGRATQNEKVVQFTMDVLATHIITILEVGAISQISFHKRPNVERGTEEEGSGGINDLFRGTSSFPSGHMVGASVLMFKGWEYYGWKAGIPATIATALIGWARIESGDHYLTDILGAVALSGIASLSTTRKMDILTNGIPTADGGRVMVAPLIGGNHWGVAFTRTF